MCVHAVVRQLCSLPSQLADLRMQRRLCRQLPRLCILHVHAVLVVCGALHSTVP